MGDFNFLDVNPVYQPTKLLRHFKDNFLIQVLREPARNGITPGWHPVTSDVLQASILRSVLFNIFINNWTQDMSAHKVSLFKILN